MNWHICRIAYRLEQVRLGKIKRLIITVPPRSLKSIMCSVAFPAFVLGHDPDQALDRGQLQCRSGDQTWE